MFLLFIVIETSLHTDHFGGIFSCGDAGAQVLSTTQLCHLLGTQSPSFPCDHQRKECRALGRGPDGPGSASLPCTSCYPEFSYWPHPVSRETGKYRPPRWPQVEKVSSAGHSSVCHEPLLLSDNDMELHSRPPW